MDLRIVNKPKDDRLQMYPFMIPLTLKKKARIVCAKRNITLAEFVRESIRKNIKNYEHLLKSL